MVLGFVLLGVFLVALVGLVLLFRQILDKAGNKILASNREHDGLTKKYFEVDVYKYGGVLGGLGLCLSLIVVITAFEWKTFEEPELIDLGRGDDNIEEVIEIPPTQQQQPPPPPKIVTPKIVEVSNEEEIEDDKDMIPEFEQDEPIAEAVVAQEVEEEEEEEEVEEVDEVHTFAEKTAEPVIGTAKFLKSIGKELKYPKTAKRMGIQGKVFIQFVVEKDGRLTGYKVVRGIGSGCDKEALRALKKITADPKKGKWKPAKQRGKPVRLRFTLPVTFKLN